MIALVMALMMQTAEPAAAEQRDLCRRAVALSGFDADLKRRVRREVSDSQAQIRALVPEGDDDTVKAYGEALAAALDNMRAPLLKVVEDECAKTFTQGELIDIVGFLQGASGQALVAKTASRLAPALESKIEELQPRVQMETQSGFCARIGGCFETFTPQDEPEAPRMRNRSSGATRRYEF